MPIENNVGTVKRLIRLVQEFGVSKELTPNEYIERRVAVAKNSISEYVVECFIQLMRHLDVIDSIAQHFWECYSLKPFNRSTVQVLIHLIMFRFENDNFATTLIFFLNFPYLHSRKLIEYFTDEDHLVAIARAASRIFDNDYILQNILQPLLAKIDSIRNLHDKLVSETIKRQSVPKKPPTIAKGPSLLQKTSKQSASRFLTQKPPTQIFPKFKSSTVPRVVITGDINLEQKIERECEKNREKAMELLRLAQTNAFKCANVAKSKVSPSPEKVRKPAFKAKKMPPTKDVKIRNNAAALMREAAALEKEEEKECKKIEQVLNGGFDSTKIEALEADIRKSIEQQNIQEIERKHLLGQLTHEEAILAKNELLRINKENYEQCRIEKASLMEQIEEWRQQEYVKIKALVEKAQSIQRAAREAEKQLQISKQRNAKLLQYETKKLLDIAYEEKEKELDRKIRLIAEIRTLHQVTMTLQTKEFDPTECPNFGLLCEMSIAELQERLGLMRLEMRRELEERRAAIADNREKQRMFMDDVKNFIHQTRMSRTRRPAPKEALKLQVTPDLVALRERLVQARNMRMATV